MRTTKFLKIYELLADQITILQVKKDLKNISKIEHRQLTILTKARALFKKNFKTSLE